MTNDTDPQQGGSYLRDPETGELTPCPPIQPKPADSAADQE